MRGLAKKIAASVLALTLVLGMCTTAFGASWTGVFLASDGIWYEGANGKLTNNTDTAWTADLETLGWNGIWGGQVKKAVTVTQGKKYTISFDITSSNIDKWVYVKIADANETLAFGDWIRVTKGKTTKYSKTFTAAVSSQELVFGIGGEMMDRDGIDKDAATRYALLTPEQKAMPDADSQAATSIKVTNFKFGDAKPGKVTLKKVKASKGGKAKVTYSKVNGAKKYQIQYSLKKNFKSAKKVTSKKTTATIKKLKKGKKYYVRVRVYNSSKETGDWSKTKTVKAK